MNNSNVAFHTLPIIGYHHSPLSQKFGIPRQPNLVAIKSQITFIPPYDTPDAFVGLENYSHLWILWQFHQNTPQSHFRPQVRPPRLGGNDKIGVFATRSMYRPSQIGLSVVGLDKLEVIDNQVILHILGADMVDGTPIFDIKPYIGFVDSISHTKSVDKPTSRPTLPSKEAKQDFEKFIQNQMLKPEDITVIKNLVAQDPRPAYRQSEIGVICTLRYKMVDVDFFMNEQREIVVDKIRVVDEY